MTNISKVINDTSIWPFLHLASIISILISIISKQLSCPAIADDLWRYEFIYDSLKDYKGRKIPNIILKFNKYEICVCPALGLNSRRLGWPSVDFVQNAIELWPLVTQVILGIYILYIVYSCYLTFVSSVLYIFRRRIIAVVPCRVAVCFLSICT